MKIIEIGADTVSIDALQKDALTEDLVIMKDGHVMFRVTRFDDEDLEEWNYEHSREAIDRGNLAREQYTRGECTSLEDYLKELEAEEDKT